MPLDPQLAAMLAQAPPWPGVRELPLGVLRQAVRDSSLMLPAAPDAAPARVEDRVAGNVPVRLYWPEGAGPHPLTLYMHGGGYVVGDLDTQDMIARALCVWAGTLIVSVDYRLAPEHPFPAGIEDCRAVLDWLVKHAPELGGDAARIAVAGDSAGANFAAALIVMARDEGGPDLAASIQFYPSCTYPDQVTRSARDFAAGPLLTADDVAWFWEQYLGDPARERHDLRVSPVRAASLAGLPPVFVATAECDPTRDDGEAWAARLVSENNHVLSIRYAGMVHGFASWLGVLPTARQAVMDAAAFLRSAFAGVSQ